MMTECLLKDKWQGSGLKEQTKEELLVSSLTTADLLFHPSVDSFSPVQQDNSSLVKYFSNSILSAFYL